ncbi:MAG: rod shape-determining protein RodA [Halofilum sp. (in: g-proteobacteria)]|nr:rod shape-determining protein RodA [Halofilum sp. (in: g-proteobacteria)]
MAEQARLVGNAGEDQSSLSRLLLALRLDPPLVIAIVALCAIGLFVLYSAGGQSLDRVIQQGVRLTIGFGAMLFAAQIPPRNLRLWAPWLFAGGLGLLLWVLLAGTVGGGAQRWISLGFVRFQPSEAMKIIVPMMVAWYLGERALPPTPWRVLVALVLVAIPGVMIARQPDLGTALLVMAAGLLVVFLAGLRWRLIAFLGVLGAASIPLLWHYMHDYQRRRVLTLLDPESDPLGAGYHIIQSKIAVGSGGLYGKGWLNGTQSHLDFIPERSTDFIFAVFGEEFGLFGAVGLLGLYAFITGRALYLASQAQDTFGRLLAGSLALTFFVYLFVNVGMVTGLLPVVGVPLPLVSYGGTSVVTLLGAFGIIMSIRSHKRLLAT